MSNSVNARYEEHPGRACRIVDSGLKPLANGFLMHQGRFMVARET